MSRLRRGRHLLGTGGHGADAVPDRRGRRFAGRPGEAGGRARGAHPQRGRAAVRRAAAGAAPRPRRVGGARSPGPLRSVAPVLRTACGRLPDGARVRGHAVGRRLAARLRRVPARVVAEPPDLRDHPRAAGALERRPTWGAGHRNFTSLYLEPLSRASRWRSLLAGLVPGAPGSTARPDSRAGGGGAAVRGRDRSDAPRPRTARRGRLRLSRHRRGRIAGGAGDAPRAGRCAPRRSGGRGAAADRRRSRSREDVQRARRWPR